MLRRSNIDVAQEQKGGRKERRVSPIRNLVPILIMRSGQVPRTGRGRERRRVTRRRAKKTRRRKAEKIRRGMKKFINLSCSLPRP